MPLDPPPERVLGRYRERDGDVPDSVFEPLDGAERAAWEGGEMNLLLPAPCCGRGAGPGGGSILAEWDDRLARDGFRPLAISSRHAWRAGSLPGAHRNPFDRMIAARSLIEALRVATPDAEIAALGADTVW